MRNFFHELFFAGFFLDMGNSLRKGSFNLEIWTNNFFFPLMQSQSVAELELKKRPIKFISSIF